MNRDDTHRLVFNSSGFAQCERACETCCAGARQVERHASMALAGMRKLVDVRSDARSRLVILAKAGACMENVRR